MKNVTNVLVSLIALLCLSLADAASVSPTTQVGTARTLPTQINLTTRDADIVVPAGPVVGCGDFNGDGIADLLEAFNDSLQGMTAGGIIFGGKNIESSGTLSISRPDLSIAPAGINTSRPWFRSLHPSIDLNGDGMAEIVAEVMDAAAPDGRPAVASYIYFGSPSLRPGEIDLLNRTPDLKIFASSSGYFRTLFSEFTGIANVHGESTDVNGDRANDLILAGSLGYRGPSVVQVILGPFAPGSVIDLQTQAPDISITVDESGFSSVKAADVNGDGSSDILINRAVNRVDIVMGSTELRPGTEISLAQGGASTVIDGISGGFPKLATGDVNGDGIADIWVGLSTRTLADGSADRTFPGEIYVVFGSRSLSGRRVSILEGQQDVTIRGAEGSSDISLPGDRFGDHIVPLDLNGDGISDILAEAVYGEGPKTRFKDSGAAYVILGSTDLRSGTTVDVGRDEQDVKMFIEEKRAHLNLLSGGAFDINGDGYSDLGLTIRRPRNPPPPFEAFVFDPLNIVLGGPVAAPEITKAKFQSDSSELVISGTNFNGAMQLEVNGVLLDRKAAFEPTTGRLRVEGTKRQLNLQSGKNELIVIRKGSRSNTVLVKA